MTDKSHIDYHETYNRKTEKQHYDEIKSLPIRMKDRRVLYGDIQAIFDFEREVQMRGGREKTIPFFHFRLFWNTFIYRLKSYRMWRNSLREIEIQRGTLTANVFYFIRHTLYFNLTLTLIVFVGIVIPHYVLFGLKVNRNAVCDSGFDQSNHNITDSHVLAECCFALHVKDTAKEIKTTKLRWLIEISKVLGGTSSWLSTPFFYGYYTTHVHTIHLKEDLALWFPLLYAGSVFTVLVLSFCVLLRNIARGIKEIVRNKDGDVCVFSELIFCGYYHRSRNENEARFRRKLWLHNVNVAIRTAKAWARRDQITSRVIVTRIIVFVSITGVIATTAFLIYIISDLAYDNAEKIPQNSEDPSSILIRIVLTFLPSFAISVSNTILPNVFIKISKLEKYTVESSTALVLYRSLIVRLLSVIVTIFRVFDKNYVCHRVRPKTCTLCCKGENRHSCWESILAREFYKILIAEMIMKIFLVFVVEPFRRMLKKAFFRFYIMRRIGTLRFNVIRQSIDIINVQVLCWIGFYFAPTFPLVVCLYLFVMFYVKKFSVLVNCIGVPESHRVTRTTTIFLSGKLVSFMLVLIFIAVVVGELEPSRDCGPFAIYDVPWTTIKELLHIKDPYSISHFMSEHLGSLSVFVPLVIVSITILYHFYARKCRIEVTAESIKELIIMEGQDKQYLAGKLMLLRSMTQKQNYFDPHSVYESEKRYVTSTNTRENLASQWKELRDAILPFGMTKAGIRRGELSNQMKMYADKFRELSSSGSEKTQPQRRWRNLSLQNLVVQRFKNRHSEIPLYRSQLRKTTQNSRPAPRFPIKVQGRPNKVQSTLMRFVNKILGRSNIPRASTKSVKSLTNTSKGSQLNTVNKKNSNLWIKNRKKRRKVGPKNDIKSKESNTSIYSKTGNMKKRRKVGPSNESNTSINSKTGGIKKTETVTKYTNTVNSETEKADKKLVIADSNLRIPIIVPNGSADGPRSQAARSQLDALKKKSVASLPLKARSYTGSDSRKNSLPNPKTSSAKTGNTIQSQKQRTADPMKGAAPKKK